MILSLLFVMCSHMGYWVAGPESQRLQRPSVNPAYVYRSWVDVSNPGS